MDNDALVRRLSDLVEAHYVSPPAGAEIAQVLRTGSYAGLPEVARGFLAGGIQTS
ncbi:hypothetical protein [Cryptosporangium phraense]|uniref:hypothetical protein n=1 Tax=Cryptosporangium phraense TaxID=2593070 RepID=UPI00147970FC|nr:hypothetical protein [Cryptosporangium phraense]